MSYIGEPVPRPAPDTAEPMLTRVVEVDAGDVTGSPGAMDQPIPSLPYHRSPFGTLMTEPPQDLAIGTEVHQAGHGRAVIPARLALPDQSVTPQPDGRRINRPMPSAGYDEAAVIR